MVEGKDVEYICYEAGDPASDDYKANWFDAKPKLKLQNAMMNLPYCSDGDDHYVVQTNACLYFLGRRFGLAGEDDEQVKQAIDQVVAQTMDLRNASIRTFYNGVEAGEPLKAHVGRVATHYEKLEGFMARNNTIYAASNEITLVSLLRGLAEKP